MTPRDQASSSPDVRASAREVGTPLNPTPALRSPAPGNLSCFHNRITPNSRGKPNPQPTRPPCP